MCVVITAHSLLIWLHRTGQEVPWEEIQALRARLDGLFPLVELKPDELPKALWGRISSDSIVWGVGRLTPRQRFALNVLPVPFAHFATPKEFAQAVQRESAPLKARVGEFLRFLAFEQGIRIFHGSEYESLKLIKYGCELKGELGQDKRGNGQMDRRGKLTRLFDFSANFRHIVYIGAGTGDSMRRAPKRSGFFDILYSRKRQRLYRKLVTFDGCDCRPDRREFEHIHIRKYITRENFLKEIRSALTPAELRETCFVWDVRASGDKTSPLWESQTSSEDRLGRLIARTIAFKFFLVKFRIPRGPAPNEEGYTPMFFCNDESYYEAYLAPGKETLKTIVEKYTDFRRDSFLIYNESMLIGKHTYKWGDAGAFINGASLMGTPPEPRGFYTLRLADPSGYGDRISSLDEIVTLQLAGFPAKSAKLLALQYDALDIHPSEASKIVLCGFRYQTLDLPELSVSTMIGLRYTSFSSRFTNDRIHILLDRIKEYGIDVSGHLTFLFVGQLEAIDIKEWMTVVLKWGERSVEERRSFLESRDRVETNPDRDLGVWHRPIDFVASLHMLHACGYISARNCATLVRWLIEQWGAGRA